MGRTRWYGTGDRAIPVGARVSKYHAELISLSYSDLEQTAARLRADEYGFVANQHKLLPVAFPNPRGRTPRFSEVYDVIADIFDEIRGDQNVVKETKFQQEIQQTRTAIQRTRIARRIDLEKKKIKDYNDILADMGYKWVSALSTR
jgi:hypothetical protein